MEQTAPDLLPEKKWEKKYPHLRAEPDELADQKRLLISAAASYPKTESWCIAPKKWPNSGTNGCRMQLWQYVGNPNQHWKLQ